MAGLMYGRKEVRIEVLDRFVSFLSEGSLRPMYSSRKSDDGTSRREMKGERHGKVPGNRAAPSPQDP
jgi:hypothetical protein